MSDMGTIQAKRNAWLKEKAETHKAKTINPVGKLAKAPNARHLAISARCWQCENGDDEDNAMARIRACPNDKRCSLHPHRPYQDGGYHANLAQLRDTAPPAPAAGTVVGLIERARLQPQSRPVAVKAYCWTCMGGGEGTRSGGNGNARDLVRECPVYACALWDVRAWKPGEDSEKPESGCGIAPGDQP